MCKDVNHIPTGFVDIRIIQYNIQNALKDKTMVQNLRDIVKANIDNRYLKFIGIEKGSITFKANKKFRDKMKDDDTFYCTYTLDFISSIFEKIGIEISVNKLQIISEVYLDEAENKITVSV